MFGKRRALSEHFEIDYETKESVCKKCNKVLKGTVSFNLKRHAYMRHQIVIHPFNYAKQTDGAGSSGIAPRSHKNTYVPQKLRTNIAITMTRKQLFRSVVEMVTRDGLPLGILSSNGFRLIIDPICKALDIQLDSTSINEAIVDTWAIIQSRIACELRGELFTLHIFTAPRFGRCILGINAQFIVDDVLIVRTLAMIELSSSLQTADDVKQIIEDTLRSFECNVQQIVSVTTDNGCELLNHCLQLDKDLGEDDDEGLHSTNIDISALLDNYQISSTARCARNASHILRLAVLEVLNKNEPNIKATRHLLRNMLTDPSARQLLIASNNDSPTLPDAPYSSSWKSTYTMVKSFVDNEDGFKTLSDLDISAESWLFMDEFHKTFGPIDDCVSELQEAQQWCAGDFMRSWIKLKFNLSNLGTSMAKEMLDQMVMRQPALIENDSMKAALFIDPRFNFAGSNSIYLSNENKTQAEAYLLSMYKHLKPFDPLNDTTHEPSATVEYIKVEDDLENFYEHELESIQSADTHDPQFTAFMHKLADLKSRARSPLNCDIFQVWLDLKHVNPEMYTLAIKMLAVPCSQASVQRALGAVEQIVPNRQTDQSAETMQQLLLLVKLNYEMLDKIR